MKTFFILIAMLSLSVQYVMAQSPIVTVSGEITTNTTWNNTNRYLLNGFVYVKNNATLTIQEGTIIKGDKNTKGSLIITRGSKIIAQGTPNMPIVFTSNSNIGSRNYGDWGGLIICGKATVNKPGGIGEVEGGVNNANGDALYGGNDDNDNSGVLQYVRIEYPGIAFSDNNEINGLTLAGVGRQTILDHIQVSFSGDDAFEFFGGTVNAKNLVALGSWDDDFDTDFGHRGNIQFATAIRYPTIADQSGSNGIETDNDGSGTFATPRTNTIFSNVTIAGPIADGGQVSINSNYKRAAHIRRASLTSIYNSLFFGFPTALLLDGIACENAAQNDSLQIRNTTFIATDPAKILTTTLNSSFDINSWFNNSQYDNQTNTNIASQQLQDPQNIFAPNCLPQNNSPLIDATNFAYQPLLNTFFQPVNYRGAFGTDDWTSTWTQYNPQQIDYSTNTAIDKIVSNQNISLYPNPVAAQTVLQIKLSQLSSLSIAIYNSEGKPVQSILNQQTVAAGNHQFVFDTTNWQNGLYYIQIVANEQLQTTRLIVKQ